MAVERHEPVCDTLFLQVMVTSDGCRGLLIPMVGEPLPDPAHMAQMAGGAEGCKVPERMGAAADRRSPEVEVRRSGVERGATPGAPVVLPLKDGPDGLVREIRVSDRHIVEVHRGTSPALGHHAEKLFFQMIYFTDLHRVTTPEKRDLYR